MTTEPPSNAIAQALGVLHKEELDLTARITKLQARIGSVRSAISSMRELLDPEEETANNPAQAILPMQDKNSSYDGMPFTKALVKFMGTLTKPATIREITDGLKSAGYVFNSKNEMTQVYVSLKRKTGLLFQLVDGNKWILIKP